MRSWQRRNFTFSTGPGMRMVVLLQRKFEIFDEIID